MTDDYVIIHGLDFSEKGYYLCHHGVKGMKWGVRKQRDPVYVPHKGDVTIGKGTSFQRITTNSNSGYTKGVYTSYKNSDKDLYKGVLGRMRVQGLLRENGDLSIKELTMTAKKDLHIPSREVRVDEFKRLYRDDPDGVMKLINDHETSRYGHSAKSGFDVNNKIQTEDAYKKFNDALSLGLGSENGKVIQKYYSNLSKKGYDAIPDENDIRLSTFKAQAPIIMFNTNKSIGKTSVRELSASEIYSAYSRSIGRKMVRDFTRPGSIGFEKLNLDIAKDAAKYARQLEKDKFELNPNYTLNDLANDWGKNRLTTSQISRVSTKMDSGKTHDEAVKETIALGNVAVDYILDQFDL